MASTTVALGAPGPQDVPGAARARRSSPSPVPAGAEVVEVADDVDEVDVVEAEDVDEVDPLEEGGAGLVVVLEAVGGDVLLDRVEGLEDVEEAGGTEALVGPGVVEVLVPEPASPWP